MNKKQLSMKNIFKSRYSRLLIFVPFIVFGGAYALWHNLYYNTPNRAWHDMLAHSLSTRSITIKTDQTGNDNTSVQTVRYTTGDQNQATATTELKQGSENQIVVEVIGTRDADYARYTTLKVNNVSNDKVIDKWAKSDHPNQAQTTDRQLLPDVVLRLGNGYGVPLVDVPVDRRGALYEQLKNNAFRTDFKQTGSETFANQAAFVFKTQVAPRQYGQYLKDMADATGFTQLKSYKPEAESATSGTTIELIVSKSSHKLIGLRYPDRATYSETYSEYNQDVAITIPEKTISFAELQSLFPAQ